MARNYSAHCATTLAWDVLNDGEFSRASPAFVAEFFAFCVKIADCDSVCARYVCPAAHNKTEGNGARYPPKCASTMYSGEQLFARPNGEHGEKYKTAAITKLRSKVATGVIRSTCRINLHASRTSARQAVLVCSSQFAM